MSSPRRIGFYYHPAFLAHDTGAGHPESPDRVNAIRAHLERTELLNELVLRDPEPASLSTLELVHPRAYIESIARACRTGPQFLDPDTVASPGSWDAALRAVGAAVDAVDETAGGALSSAFCAVRPPGHHALADRAMGFCLFNNVAVAARHAQQRRGLARVLIVDWDVHHGNGTQDIFYNDPTVFYFSTHQTPFYPGTGHAHERGEEPGNDHTLNVPLPAGSGDSEVMRAFQEKLIPAAREFRPDIVFISAGFDAHKRDPLAGLNFTEQGYAALTRVVRGIADEFAQGRLVSALEGGYDLDALSRSVEAHLKALLEE